MTDAERIAQLEAELLRQKQVNAELHQGVCHGYGALMAEKIQLARELKELRESTGDERFRLAVRLAIGELKAAHLPPQAPPSP